MAHSYRPGGTPTVVHAPPSKVAGFGATSWLLRQSTFSATGLRAHDPVIVCGGPRNRPGESLLAATGDVRVVCQVGRDEGLLSDMVVSARDEPSGHGVVGTAIRENRSVIVQDARRDRTPYTPRRSVVVLLDLSAG